MAAEDCCFAKFKPAELSHSDISIAVDVSLHQFINFVIVQKYGACNLTFSYVHVVVSIDALLPFQHVINSLSIGA